MIGGEQSGHIIFRKYAHTGDGLITALMLMQVMIDTQLPLSVLAAGVTMYPQVLKKTSGWTIRISRWRTPPCRPPWTSAPPSWAIPAGCCCGKSGTEPVLRVMAEAGTAEECEKQVDHIIAAMEKERPSHRGEEVMLTVNELYDLSHSLAGDYLKQFTYPWEALAGISDLILEIGKQLPEDEYVHPTDWDGNVLEDVWVAKDATVFKTAYLHGPCIIGHRTEVRQCAFIRGSALVGNDCVVGNSTELKNVILFDGVQVPHYNYVGDSILGYKSHYGRWLYHLQCQERQALGGGEATARSRWRPGAKRWARCWATG